MKTKLLLTVLLSTIYGLSIDAQTITTVAGSGTQGYGGDGSAATSASLHSPVGIAFDASGNMYIADDGNHRIRKVNVSGTITTIGGTGVAGFGGDGGLATAAQLKNPTSVALDAFGNIYIADYQNNRIRKITISSGTITTVAGTGAAGFSGDGGLATAALLNAPSSIALDTVGNLYIVDAANHAIRKVTTSGKIATIAGNGLAGFSGDGGLATSAKLNTPFGVAVDASGNNIYIADQYNYRIRKVTSGTITTVAGSGTFGYSGDGGLATSSQLNTPVGVALDATGNLFIADEYNHVIRKVLTSNGFISTVAGNGIMGFSGDGGLATTAELHYPYGVSFDASGNLYIADWGNNRIRKVTNVGTTSIKQFQENNYPVLLYPNPNTGSFIIETNSQIQSLQMFDVSGKLVLSQSQIGNSTIDACGLNNGVYNVRLTGKEGVLNKRLVIVR